MDDFEIFREVQFAHNLKCYGIFCNFSKQNGKSTQKKKKKESKNRE